MQHGRGKLFSCISHDCFAGFQEIITLRYWSKHNKVLPESSNRPLRICNLLSEITEEESGHADIRRPGRDKRASVVSTVTLASAEYEREFLQRNRDISVTFGYGETGSTQDLRWAEDLFNIKALNISISKSLPSFIV